MNFKKIKKDDLGEVMVPVFKLDIIFNEKLRETHKLFNRAENLALEVIILATRLKIARGIQNQTLFTKISEKIKSFIEDIERFGYNKRALKATELVSDYISKL